MWLLSALVYVSGGATFLFAEKLFPLVWLARIAYSTGLAGMFSCSMVHIQNQVPAHRRTKSSAAWEAAASWGRSWGRN